MPLRADESLDMKRRLAGLPQKNADGKWPPSEEWPSIKAVVVCRTTGCPVEGIGFEVTLYIQADGALLALCGRCEVYHTDIRGDLKPVGADILAELMANPKLFQQKKREFKKRRQDEEKAHTPPNPNSSQH